jgi:hypothetical protein
MASVVVLNEVVPCAGAVLTITEAGLSVPPGSVSLVSTAIATAWFSGVAALSATAVGLDPPLPGAMPSPAKVATAPARLAELPAASLMLAPVGSVTPVMASDDTVLSELATL